jgi:IS30 family transposase
VDWSEARRYRHFSHYQKVILTANHLQFRSPKELTVDNGKSFDCQDFREYCHTTGTRLRFASVYHPQSNNAVQRANGQIFSAVKKCLFD